MGSLLQFRANAFDQFDKFLDFLARRGLEHGRHQRIFHGGKHGTFPLVAGPQEPFHGDVAQSARRHIGDSQQADVVVGIDQRFHVGEEILDLPPVEEALAADQMVAHSGRAQGGFNGTRLLVRPEKDGTIAPLRFVRQPLELDLRHNFAGFIFICIVSLNLDFGPGAIAGPQGFPTTADVVLDDGVGRIENIRGAPIILLQLDDLDLGKMLLQVQQIGHLRSAPAVNALVIIADDAKVAMFLGERMDQFKLGGVGVLIFVHHHILIFFAAGGQCVGMPAKKPEGQQNQIVKIHGVASVQGGFIFLGNMQGQRAHIRIAKHAGRRPGILEFAQHGEHRAGIGLFAFDGNGGQDFFYGRQLLGFVIDDEIALVTQFFDVLAENPDAQGVKGANRWPAVGGTDAGGDTLFDRQEFADAFLHFAGRFIGESHAQDVLGQDAASHHVSDAIGDHPRLAGARASQNQQGTLNGLHGLALLRVQTRQIQHRARSLNPAPANASLTADRIEHRDRICGMGHC